MIEIKNLSKKYGTHVAVDNISFTVEPGRIYGFLGPNGAGKSTTMNMITGYIGNSSGSIVINGHDILEEPEAAKRCIGYLPELPPLYMDMSVLEYLEFAAELKKIPKAERKAQIQQAMEMTMLEDVAKRIIKNLSKGYKQRVGLAQAVLGFPEIIILDEPTVGLDPVQIIEIRELIKELGKEHTVILSSHILSEIQAVCDYVFIISKGKLVADDTTENLIGRMSGSQEIELTVKGSRESVESALSKLSVIEKASFVSAAEAEENEQEIQMHILAQKGVDIREAVFYRLAEEKLPILEMHTMTKSLEDVFIELTQEGEN